MSIKNNEDMISDHYTSGRLIDAISSGIKGLGKTEKTVTIDDLGPVDEFHIGGRQASKDFLDQLNLKPEMNVLDIGCGTGRTTLYMLNKGLQVVGLELSYKSLKLIRGEFPTQLVQATNIELPLGTGTVDVAISDGDIPYTDDPYKALSETLRSLKSGGRALVAVYKRNHFYYYAYTYAGGLMRFINNYSIGAKLLTSIALPAYHCARNILRR